VRDRLNPPDPSGRRKKMSEERFEQGESTEKDEDVEAHARNAMANDEPSADDESDDVEAHARRASQREV
jgi:hypothetical protein